MAILRDAQTGAGVAQGQPVDLIPIADQLGEEVIWDDVPEDFDPEAIKEAYRKSAEHLIELSQSAESMPTEQAERLQKEGAEQLKQLEPDAEVIDEVTSKIEEARKQAENPV